MTSGFSVGAVLAPPWAPAAEEPMRSVFSLALGRRKHRPYGGRFVRLGSIER